MAGKSCVNINEKWCDVKTNFFSLYAHEHERNSFLLISIIIKRYPFYYGIWLYVRGHFQNWDSCCFSELHEIEQAASCNKINCRGIRQTDCHTSVQVWDEEVGWYSQNPPVTRDSHYDNIRIFSSFCVLISLPIRPNSQEGASSNIL